MRILVLTELNPVLAGIAFNQILNGIDPELKEKTTILSVPVFAEIEAQMKDKEYLPTLFSMLKAASNPKTFKKLNRKEHFIMVGNSYKKTKFDFVVALDERDEEVFDRYIDAIQNDEDYEKLYKLLKLEQLYFREDASLVLPTIDHVMLFIREALTN